MPNKKNNTTLVTEDQLVEVVSARVTGQIRQDMDERFARFEQMLERVAAPRDEPPQSSTDSSKKRAAEDDQEPSRPPTKVPRQVSETPVHDISHSSIHNYEADGLHFPLRPTHGADGTGRMAHALGVQEARAAYVNINNDASTWAAWFGAQQPFSSQPAVAAPGSVYDTTGIAPADIDAHVRHILDASPNQFKGNVPVGIYPFKQVTRGLEKKKLSFNTVTLAEHIYGMFRIIDDIHTSPTIKPYIITHMREVAEDACEFEWPGYVRRWSEEVFNLIAENRLPGGWGATARIQNLRTGMSRVDAARLTFAKEAPVNKRPVSHSHQQSEMLRGGPPCSAFNSSQGCALQSGHVQAGKRQIHVCSYCLLNNAAAHPHSEALCRNKQRNTASHFQ